MASLLVVVVILAVCLPVTAAVVSHYHVLAIESFHAHIKETQIVGGELADVYRSKATWHMQEAEKETERRHRPRVVDPRQVI